MKTISPFQLSGTIKIIPSKSISHRALICAALAKGISTIRNIAFSDDITATATALCDMGLCELSRVDDCCIISGGQNKEGKLAIDCGESGSTLRFLLPLGLDGKRRKFLGHGRLMKRPIGEYDRLFARNGVEWEKGEDGITLCGEIEGGEYALPGNVSSQFVSGLLFKLPLLMDDSGIHITTEIESKAYIEITQDVQQMFGVRSRWNGNVIEVAGRQGYVPCDMEIEGDYSHAAFYAAGAAMSGKVEMLGLSLDSKQGDREILGILECMGACVIREEHKITVKQNELRPIEIDVSQIPDLVPILAVIGCAAEGKTRIYNAGRLRYKESDRLHAIAMELEKLGADITEYQDCLVVNGTGILDGGVVDSHNDHRIAMALAMAACIAKQDIVIQNSSCVKKSAPDFYQELTSVGGVVR